MNLSDKPYQYLYTEGDQVHLLDLETFEEIEMTVNQCESSVNMLEGKYTYSIKVYVAHSNAPFLRFYACFS